VVLGYREGVLGIRRKEVLAWVSGHREKWSWGREKGFLGYGKKRFLRGHRDKGFLGFRL
jgi:hypothetical protein